MSRYSDLLEFLSGNPDAKAKGKCWVWPHKKVHDGYGLVWHPTVNKYRRVHRIAYEVAYGPIPDGMVLDHLCRTRECYRPSHLRAVTVKENLLADGSRSLVADLASRKACPQGHPLSGDNLNPYSLKHGHRTCLTCKRARNRDYMRVKYRPRQAAQAAGVTLPGM